MRYSVLIFCVVLWSLMTVTVNAEIPQMINYQGKVTDSGGTPVVDGDYTMRFRIYDAVSSGNLEWDSGNRTVAVIDGIFNVGLGESPQPALSLGFNEDYWLLVTFSGDDQTPRKRLGSVGYAYMASGLVAGTEVSGSVNSGTYAAIKGTNTATAGITYGIFGSSTSTDGRGIYGYATAGTGTTHGVYGLSISPSGRAVYGEATATWGVTHGIYGRTHSSDGRGVSGWSSATTGTNYGGAFSSASTSGRGVFGHAYATSGFTYGGYFENASPNGRGVYSYATATTGRSYGVHCDVKAPEGYGVYAISTATIGTNYGVYGQSFSPDGYGVCGVGMATTDTAYGVVGYSSSTSGHGIHGWAGATSGINVGVFGEADSPAGYAGFFWGDVYVNGGINKPACSFLIDHPLDPENRLLRHNCMESPEHLAVYRGKIQLGADGEAAVKMPEYFKPLTKEDEATIHLTAVGSRPFLTGYEWGADYGGFTAYGEPNREVSWIVMAERDDPVIRRLARPVEEDKGPDNKFCDRGKLLHPTAYGYPESMGRNYELHEKERRQMEEELARAEHEGIRMTNVGARP